MTHNRRPTDDADLTRTLRALYAAPTDESYWQSLEARILAHVALGYERRLWWTELPGMLRPGLVAAAALILLASMAMFRSRQLETRSAYASVIANAPASIEPSSRAASLGDGDAAIHLLIAH